MKNQIIFITGGTSGIGKSLVKQLQGSNQVITCGRNLEKLIELKNQFPRIEIIQLDISNKNQIIEAKKTITQKYGKLDILINNAGIGTYVDLNENESNLDFSDFNVNLLGTIQMTQFFMPLLRNSSQPKIGIVSSIVAKVPIHNIPFYSASKAALHSYCLSLRKIVKDIDIMEVLPPIVDTPMTETVDVNNKLSPDQVATSIIEGLDKNKKEVYPGMAKAANFMSKVLFSKIESLLNAA